MRWWLLPLPSTSTPSIFLLVPAACGCAAVGLAAADAACPVLALGTRRPGSPWQRTGRPGSRVRPRKGGLRGRGTGTLATGKMVVVVVVTGSRLQRACRAATAARGDAEGLPGPKTMENTARQGTKWGKWAKFVSEQFSPSAGFDCRQSATQKLQELFVIVTKAMVGTPIVISPIEIRR